MRIMLVEDDESLGLSLKDYLSREGFEVEIAMTLAHARGLKVDAFDLVILDWMLPDGQGLDYLKDLRAAGHAQPVLFLTARADLVDRVLGLEMGADDYLTKPFEPRELLARIRTRLRASPTPPAKDWICVGPLQISRVQHKVEFAGRAVDLVKKEFDLLVLFAEHPERVFSRDEILNKVWGYDVFPTTRTVDTHVMLLRQKLEAELIETVRAVGYRFRLPVSANGE